MHKIEKVPCVPCNGKGVRKNQFTGNNDTCSACDGDCYIYPCEGFSSSRSPVFRNRTCDFCYATEEQHKLIADYNEIVEEAMAKANN